ncbi:hypothetical protein [Actinoplanes sp. NPDC051851]|uniref:hypothetical protein n=1 Tax=Actinoplanes sp. NPDC051851 TaxID=3154753 RepID=UPI00343F2C85
MAADSAGSIGHSAPLGALRPIANQCTAGNCPTVYVETDSDLSGTATAVVQGYVVSPERAGIELPEGEVLVEVPISLLAEAVRNLPAQQGPPGRSTEEV